MLNVCLGGQTIDRVLFTSATICLQTLTARTTNSALHGPTLSLCPLYQYGNPVLRPSPPTSFLPASAVVPLVHAILALGCCIPTVPGGYALPATAYHPVDAGAPPGFDAPEAAKGFDGRGATDGRPNFDCCCCGRPVPLPGSFLASEPEETFGGG